MLLDFCRECGVRIQFVSIDRSPYAFHHITPNGTTVDDEHTPEPRNPTFRYLIDRWNEQKASA